MRRALLGALTSLALLTPASPASGDKRLVEIFLVEGVASGKDLAAASGHAHTLVLVEGDSVELRWTSNRDMMLHFHGYDLEAHAGQGRHAAMSFVARVAGRFPVETHDANGRHRAIIYIEIHPK